MTDKLGLNRSANLLGSAMRHIFTGAVEDTVDPTSTEMKPMRTDMRNMSTV